MVEICFVKVSRYKIFNPEEFSEQSFWSVKDPKGTDAKTKVSCEKLTYDKTEVLKEIQYFSRGLFYIKGCY